MWIADKTALTNSPWSSMYFIQVMLTCRLHHELPDAIIQSAVNY